MFKYLNAHTRILVTGPQRSGTTICAKMIADDTGLRFMAEGHMAHNGSASEERDELERVLAENDNVVIQCPIQCRWVHTFRHDGLAVVMMRRRLEDIKASEVRIGWGDARQRNMYEGLVHGSDDMHIAEVKWHYWEASQKNLIDHPYEVHYEDLHKHPLWVHPNDRDNWGPRRIDVEDAFHNEIWV